MAHWILHYRAIASVAVSLVAPSALPISAEPIQPVAVPGDQRISFTGDLLPVLRQNCVACHNATKAEADVNLETYESVMASEYGELVAANDLESSRLYQLAAHLDEPVMPPASNAVAAKALTAEQLGLLKAWIERGARADPPSTSADSISWKALPNETAPTYATAITADGRLIAASRGQRVHVYGRRSETSLGELVTRQPDGADATAHRDYVQDLHMSNDGRLVISAGYRTVKLWSLAQPTEVSTPEVSTPEVSTDGAAAIAFDSMGAFLAVLDAAGVIHVAAVGESDWLWSRSVDPSTGNAEAVLSVSDDGSVVALGRGRDVLLATRDGVDRLTHSVDVSAVCVSRPDRLVVGDVEGAVTSLMRAGDDWATKRDVLANAPITRIDGLGTGTESYSVTDTGKHLGVFSSKSGAFENRLAQQTAVTSVALTDGGTIWSSLSSGELVAVDAESGTAEELAKHDPVLVDRWNAARWETVVDNRRVAAAQADLKSAQANEKSERDNQAKLTAEIEKKAAELKAAKEKHAKAVEDAKAAAETLEKAQSVATPSEDEIAKAKKLADEADEAARTLEEAVAEADAAARIAEAAKARSDGKLEELATEVATWTTRVERAKVQQSETKELEKSLGETHQASLAADAALFATADGRGFVTASLSSGHWSLWSAAGDWIAALDGLPDASSLIAASRGVALFRNDAGGVSAYRVSGPTWMLKKSLGDPDGDSPFADRVLCLDVHPDGDVLATGGGQPSRRGDVHLWKLSDGSLIRTIEGAHQDTVLSLSFSPDGQRLATTSADQLIRIWSVSTGELEGVLEGHTHHVTAVGWNVSQRQLVSASADSDLRAWDLNTMKTSRKISLFKSEVTDVAYAGDSNRVAVVGGDQTFRVVLTDNGRQESSAGLANGYAYSVSPNRDGTVFVVGGADGVPRLVDRAGKTVLALQPQE